MTNNLTEMRKKRWGRKPEQVTKSFLKVHSSSRKGERKNAK